LAVGMIAFDDWLVYIAVHRDASRYLE